MFVNDPNDLIWRCPVPVPLLPLGAPRPSFEVEILVLSKQHSAPLKLLSQLPAGWLYLVCFDSTRSGPRLHDPLQRLALLKSSPAPWSRFGRHAFLSRCPQWYNRFAIRPASSLAVVWLNVLAEHQNLAIFKTS